MDERRVAIVGTGLATSIGRTAPATAAAIRGGLNGFQLGRWRDRFGQPAKVALAEYLSPTLVGVDRMVALATSAMREAVAPFPQEVVANAPAWLGVAATRPGWSAEAAIDMQTRLTAELQGILPLGRMQVVPAGHAAVLLGLHRATELIRRGEFNLALVGGVDSYWLPETLAWLDARRRLLSEGNPDGFIPGEAAGFCVIAAQDFADRNGFGSPIEIEEYGSAEEPYPFISDGVCLGHGLTTAMRQALSGHKADWTICDLNGESFRAQEWIYAYLRTAKSHGDPVEIWQPADCTGDVGAATGAILAGVACASLMKGYGRGHRPLLWTSADHGPRACVRLVDTRS